MPKLGVNIDHVATLRQARRIAYPDPIEAARLCEDAGCDSIVCHLREDRRHINDNDVYLLKETVRSRFNLEMSIAKEIVDIACKVRPDEATLVPEKREELTTEGGLDVISNGSRIEEAVRRLKAAGIKVSLFIDPEEKHIDISKSLGTDMVEFHTGQYADSKSDNEIKVHLENLRKCVKHACGAGLIVNAGHGLNYQNTGAVARINGIEELNIGHSIISYAVLAGLPAAVKEMKRIIS